MIEIEINSREVQARIDEAATKLENMRPLMQRIAGVLEHETEANFAAQGRPHWAPHSKATIAARMKRNKGSSVLKILQDRGILASSISTAFGDDFAQIGVGGAARDYAAIHQFGGTIDRAPQSRKTRLRTDAKGNLVRQGDEGSAKGRAVFAKDRHKRVRETWNTVGPYQITIPARPYLPFTGSGPAARLQPEAERSVLDAIQRMLAEVLG
ncbi:phage virion morphogenesis protein [Thauera sp. 2A1]|uniref:phage virion morphogenesis protein n=1 Tax=Thauera sp. 2A1 TaxID=2570191 RepID=UPI00129265EF|nr:phage virion morphogenesis protein [Thauera sp. 2A1]KAI5914576.1 phage virion morphogenesis protein [Thauera sp. 2A1]